MSVRFSAAASLAALSLAAMAQPAPPPPPPAGAQSGQIRLLNLGGSRSYLGVNVKEVDENRAKELKLKEAAGVEITTVETDGPAFKAGFKTGDVVLELNGQRVEGTEQFIRMVRETPVGRVARMKIWRGGAGLAIAATIGERQLFGMGEKEREKMEKELSRLGERMRTIPQMVDIPRPYMSWRSGMLGIEGESLEGGQLADFFGVKEGVMVRTVAKDMPAAKAGIKAGDVIVKVEDTKVATLRDITSAIRSAKGKKPLRITLVRGKSEMVVDAEVESMKDSAAPKAATVGNPQEFEFEFDRQ